MPKVKSISLIFLLLCSCFLGAQSYPAEAECGPYINIEATSEMKIEPDEIYIRIEIIERQMDRRLLKVSEQEDSLKIALTAIGIPLSDLRLNGMGASYVEVPWYRRDTETLSRSNYKLLVHDALSVAKVFEVLDRLKIENAFIERVDHSDIINLKKEVRKMAMRAAKEKADYLLAEVDARRGTPLIIEEVEANYSHSNSNIRGARGSNSINFIDGVKVAGSVPTPRQAELRYQKLTLKAAVFVKFSIVQETAF
jgi:hypothetical protein